MLMSMDSAISALSQFQEALNVTANNIANVNTVGFKSATVNFEDTFSQTIGAGGSGGSEQVGTGVGTATISNQFTSGSMAVTGNATDLAINNSTSSANSFFIVKDPVSGNTFATQDGSFNVDNNGYLVTSTGLRVQGYTSLNPNTLGDIKIDNAGATTTVNGVVTTDTSAVKSFAFGSDGTLTITQADGNTFQRGQVLLQNFTSPQNLVKAGNNLFTSLSSAGPQTTLVVPGQSGSGTIVAGSLEMSNVNLANELTSLITTQRAYEANSKVITTSDDILQTLVNLKR